MEQTDARDVLRQIIIDLWPRCRDRFRRLESLLRDLCGGNRREITLLVSAARENVPGELTATSRRPPCRATCCCRVCAPAWKKTFHHVPGRPMGRGKLGARSGSDSAEQPDNASPEFGSRCGGARRCRAVAYFRPAVSAAGVSRKPQLAAGFAPAARFRTGQPAGVCPPQTPVTPSQPGFAPASQPGYVPPGPPNYPTPNQPGFAPANPQSGYNPYNSVRRCPAKQSRARARCSGSLAS